MNNSKIDLTKLPDELVLFINTYLVNQLNDTNYILKPRVSCNNLVPNKTITISEIITRRDNRLELIPVYDYIDEMKVSELKEAIKNTGNYARSTANKASLRSMLKRIVGTVVLPINDILNKCPDIILNVNINTKRIVQNDWLF